MSEIAATLNAEQRRTPWALAAVLLAAGAAAAVFWVVAAFPYLALDRAHFGLGGEAFWPRRYELLVHIAGGTLALFIGPLQLWLGATRRALRWHRTLGKLYVLGVAVGAGSAYYLAVTTPYGWVYASGLFGLAVAWTVTTGMACLAIRRRHFDQHREWMIRSYVVTLAFVLFRVLVVALAGVGDPADVNAAVAWICWAVPLLIAEPLLQLPKLNLEHR
jgi:uncharacterized membrane protein